MLLCRLNVNVTSVVQQFQAQLLVPLWLGRPMGDIGSLSPAGHSEPGGGGTLHRVSRQQETGGCLPEHCCPAQPQPARVQLHLRMMSPSVLSSSSIPGTGRDFRAGFNWFGPSFSLGLIPAWFYSVSEWRVYTHLSLMMDPFPSVWHGLDLMWSQVFRNCFGFLCPWCWVFYNYKCRGLYYIDTDIQTMI